MKKILTLILIITLLFTGCGKKKLNVEMDNKDNYRMRITINSNINNKSENTLIAVNKYDNTQIKIDYNDETYYIFDNEYYKDEFKKDKIKDVKLKNYNVFLEGLNNLSKLEKEEEDLIGKKAYTFNKFEMKEKEFKKIIDYNYKFNKNINGIVYHDNNGNLESIKYEVEDENNYIEVKVLFSNYGSIKEIKQKLYEDYVEVKKEHYEKK